MVDLNHKIGELKKKLDSLASLLKETGQKVKSLENQNHQEIQTKEKELEAWREKLELVQQERDQIRKEVKEKVKELEQSNLANTDKQAQINQLLTQNNNQLEELDKMLYEERTHYRKIRDRIFEKLFRPCETCKSKEQHISTLQNRVRNLQIWTFLLLLASIFHFFLFLWVVFRKKKKNRVLVCLCCKKSAILERN